MRSDDWAIGTCNARAATPESATIDNVGLKVDVEALADVWQQDAEGGSVEFVDGIQREEHEERKRGLSATYRGEPHHRMGDAELEPPPRRRVVNRHRWLLVAFGGCWCRHG